VVPPPATLPDGSVVHAGREEHSKRELPNAQRVKIRSLEYYFNGSKDCYRSIVEAGSSG